MSGMDDLAVKADVQSVLRRFGYKGKFSDLFADVFRYFVYVIVGLAIFNLLGIESFLSYLHVILIYLPKAVFAFLIVFVGLVVFSHVEEFLVSYYRREGIMDVIDGTEPSIPSYHILAKLIKYIGIITTLILAMAVLGFDRVFLYIVATVLISATVGVFIIGFRDILRNLAISVYLQHSLTFESGKRIEVNGRKGKLVHVTPLYAKVKGSDGYFYVPNTELLENTVEYEE